MKITSEQFAAFKRLNDDREREKLLIMNVENFNKLGHGKTY